MDEKTGECPYKVGINNNNKNISVWKTEVQNEIKECTTTTLIENLKTGNQEAFCLEDDKDLGVVESKANPDTINLLKYLLAKFFDICPKDEIKELDIEALCKICNDFNKDEIPKILK